MRATSILIGAAICATGCTTNTSNINSDPRSESTLTLCRTLASSADQEYRNRVVQVLVRRGATVEKCQRLISTDNAVVTGIAVAGVAAAAGAAAHNGYGGGGYPRPYGVAWDQFYNENYQLIWRCRDKATGRFVYDYYCNGLPMIDTTWPGWSA
jgi:hypothetical protein